ncbi:uncharacterized protein B0H18DRAFT_960262 [Fomitopsis serialis]|uniref:uncharacterized protein n=1 Tax=Fomitopsis serialis TaxID=139415 RepID=UPI002008A097|nr:uncharacterized protein B0H18DRAFT_960262 [Neoantrodia serialis]KAH9913535.1 hypothetical protein B0H18DRAFT_960262 [Neoantrodia serialis]
MTTIPTENEIKIDEWEEEDRDQVVRIVTITGAKMRKGNPDNQKQKLVHWRCGLAYSIIQPDDENTATTGWRSVTLDTFKSDEKNPDVTIEMVTKKFLISSNAPGLMYFNPVKTFTTTDIYNWLQEKRFHRYRYDENGSGCGFWTWTVISALEADGFIVEGSGASCKKEFDRVRENPTCWVPYDQGTFYEIEGASSSGS